MEISIEKFVVIKLFPDEAKHLKHIVSIIPENRYKTVETEDIRDRLFSKLCVACRQTEE
jgi:hypothetical protein